VSERSLPLTRQQALIALSSATRFMTGILMGTGMAVLVDRTGGTEFAVSMVLTAYFLGMTVFAPVWGAVADVTGRRRAVMVLTGGLATVAVVPLVFVDGVWLPIGLRFVYAVFAVGFVPVMLTIVSARGGDEGRGRSVGFFNSARAVGFTGGQLVVGALLGILAPPSLYAVIAAVSLVATVAVLFVEDPTPDPGEDPSLEELLGEVRHRLLPAVGDREHLRTNGLRWLYVALALRNMTVLGTMSLAPVFLVAESGVGLSGFDATVAGLPVTGEFVMGVVLALNPASQAVFMLLFGRVADGLGRKPLIVAGMAGSGVFALAAATAALPAVLAARVGVALVAWLTIGAAFSAMTTGAIAFIGDVAPRDRESELMGLRSTAKGVGGVVGPPIIGGVATVTTIGTGLAVGSGLAFVAAVVAFVGLTESYPAERSSVVVPGDD
jgi:MFS family permease